MIYFILGMSLMLNLVFIIGLVKCYKKIFNKVGLSSFTNLYDLDFNTSLGKIKEDVKKENKSDLSEVFKTSSDINDFWK